MSTQEQWMTAQELAAELKITVRSVRRLAIKGSIAWRMDQDGVRRYRMPAPTPRARTTRQDAEAAAIAYAAAPASARERADRYLAILTDTNGLDGVRLRDWVAAWNKAHPEELVSVASIQRARKIVASDGAAGLLARWGTNKGSSRVPDALFRYWLSCMQQERGVSARTAWQETLGYAQRNEPGFQVSSMPSVAAFLRRYRTEVGPAARDYARNGRKHWHNSHSFYISRDWSNILAGQVWVGDHHQIDVATEMPNGDVVYPWITAWADAKSGKLVGWEVRHQDPNSDSILMAFHRAGREHPIPSELIVDNGKDYRSRSVTGGLRRVTAALDERKMQSLTAQLGIRVHFALPYNARAKLIERQFKTFKQVISASLPGYRGGNVLERPDTLKQSIARRRILPFDTVCSMVDTYITEVLNRTRAASGHRAGKCPDEIWQAELPLAIERGLARSVCPDALVLCCTRVYGPYMVRNARLRIAELQAEYFDDALFGLEGVKVLVRCDPRHYETAWVMDVHDGRLLCAATLLPRVPGLVETDVEREELQARLALQRRHERAVREAAQPPMAISASEKLANMVAGTAALNAAYGFRPSPVDTSMAAVVMTGKEKALELERKRRALGRHDLREIAPDAVPTRARGTFDLVNGYVPAASAG